MMSVTVFVVQTEYRVLRVSVEYEIFCILLQVNQAWHRVTR